MVAQRIRVLTVADPVRALLAILSTWIATGGAILALGTAQRVNQYLALRTRDGLVLTIANAAQTSQGRLKYQDPPEFPADLGERLRRDYPRVSAASALDSRWWERIQVGETLYRPRQVVGAEPDYAAVVGLDLVAGRFIDKEDMTEARGVVVLAAEAARILFGDLARAPGSRILRLYRQPVRTADGPGWRWAKVTFEVVGVFRDPAPLLRDLYGVPDFIIPMSVGRDPGYLANTIAVRVEGDDERRAGARLEALVRAHLGEATVASVWRGRDPRTDATIRRSRRERAGVSILFGLFASAALLVGGVGLVAVMMAESMERERENGIRRCLGATRRDLILAGGFRALTLATLGLAAGTATALALAPATLEAVLPIAYADADVFRSVGIPLGASLPAVAVTWATTAALALAAGTLPASSLIGARPAENLRGDA